jgi:hypothetical protein
MLRAHLGRRGEDGGGRTGGGREISAHVHAMLTTHVLAPTAGGQGLRDEFYGGPPSAR